MTANFFSDQYQKSKVLSVHTTTKDLPTTLKKERDIAVKNGSL